MSARARSALLPLASGVLLAASTPPAVSPLLPFVALVPLAVQLGEWRAAAWSGFVVGVLAHGWGLRWLPFAFASVVGSASGPGVGATATAWLAFVAILAALGAFTAAAAWAAQRLMVGGLPAALALPLGWTAAEWTLAHLPFGLAFPWAPLGLGLARWPETLGVAELVGISGVTAWLACVNGLLADAVVVARRSSHPGAARPAPGRGALARMAAALLLALAPIGWGIARATTLDGRTDEPPLGRVAAVALDVPPSAADPAWTSTAVDASMRELAGVSAGDADLVVLPEMVLALDPASPERTAQAARLNAEAERIGAPLVVGALGADGDRAYNSGIVLGPRAPADFRADKRRLVPGVERAATVHAPWLAPTGSGGYAEGTGISVADAGSLRPGILICYEVAFGGDARALVRRRANVLVALTSDAWFGGVVGARGGGIAQQEAHLVVRAIETRTAAVRSANGGPAVLIAPSGKEIARVESGVARGVLSPGPGLTVYGRTGDVTGPIALAALVLLLVPRKRHDSFR